MTRELVSRWFDRIPEYERDLPLLVVNGVAYTPRATLQEVRRGTDLGRKLQSLVEAGRFGTEERTLAKLRLKTMLETMPEKPLVATLAIPPRTFTPRELAEEVQRETDIGQTWIKGELAHMRFLMGLR